MPLPNFFIIGAPRCGTSSLYDGVQQHPDVFMSAVKEPAYFSIGVRSKPFHGPKDAFYNFHLSREEYEDLFSLATNEKIIGEASTDYLYSESAFTALSNEFPNAKYVVMLRNPAERAYSHFIQHTSQWREPCPTFRKAIQEEEQRIQQDWCHHWYYQSLGFYHRQLSCYFDAFGSGQMKIFLTDDLHRDPDKVYQDLFQFLDVDDSFQPSEMKKKHNASYLPDANPVQKLMVRYPQFRSTLAHLFPRKLRTVLRGKIMTQHKTLENTELEQSDRQFLIDGYRDDIEKLSNLINRDLSDWLVTPQVVTTHDQT